MKNKKRINKCKREIKARILAAGYTMAEATEDENCKFVLYIGSKRQMFEKYLEQAYSL